MPCATRSLRRTKPAAPRVRHGFRNQGNRGLNHDGPGTSEAAEPRAGALAPDHAGWTSSSRWFPPRSLPTGVPVRTVRDEPRPADRPCVPDPGVLLVTALRHQIPTTRGEHHAEHPSQQAATMPAEHPTRLADAKLPRRRAIPALQQVRKGPHGLPLGHTTPKAATPSEHDKRSATCPFAAPSRSRSSEMATSSKIVTDLLLTLARSHLLNGPRRGNCRDPEVIQPARPSFDGPSAKRSSTIARRVPG